MDVHTNPPEAMISPNSVQMLAHLNLLRKHALSLRKHYPDVPDDTALGIFATPTDGEGASMGISFPVSDEITDTNPKFLRLVQVARKPYWSVYIRACTGPSGKSPSLWGNADAQIQLAMVIDRDGGPKNKYGAPHPLPPSCRIETSTGSAHDWYLFNGAVTADQFSRIAAGVKELGADAPPSRAHLYRIVGTVNWPKESKRLDGRVPELVTRSSTNPPGLPKRYSADELVAASDSILASLPAQSISQRAAALVRDQRGSGGGRPVDKAKLLDALRCIPADGYHDWINVGMALKHELGPEGLPIWDAWSETAHNYSGPAEIEAKWDSFQGRTDKPVTAGTIFKLAHDHGWVDHGAASGDFADGDGSGGARKVCNLASIVGLLESDDRFQGLVGFNQFTGREDLLRHLPVAVEGAGLPNELFKPRPITDKDQLHMRLVVQQTKGFAKATRDDVNGALSIMAERHAYNPLQDYLVSLRWDGVPRLSTFLADIGARTLLDPESPASLAYVSAVSRSVFISAVARAMEPGCKVDTVLVMEGVQGAGKSRFISELVPDPAWASDNLPKDLGSKDAEAHLQGKWVIELPELSALKRSDAETTKAFLTKQVERFRPVFGRNEITWPRTCIFVGSTNASDYLQDPTGNRRFLPLRFTVPIPKGTVAAVRDQLWAEAMVAYRSGEPWWLEGEMLESARAEQAARMAGDPWLDRLPTVLDAMRAAYRIPTVANILGEMGVVSGSQHSGHSVRMAGLLKRLGYESEQRRIGGTKTRFWWHADHGEPPFEQWAAKAEAKASEAPRGEDWDD